MLKDSSFEAYISNEKEIIFTIKLYNKLPTTIKDSGSSMMHFYANCISFKSKFSMRYDFKILFYSLKNELKL